MGRSFGLLGLGAGCFLGEGREQRVVTVLSLVFVFQVYTIISVQLLITVAIIAVFTFV